MKSILLLFIILFSTVVQAQISTKDSIMDLFEKDQNAVDLCDCLVLARDYPSEEEARSTLGDPVIDYCMALLADADQEALIECMELYADDEYEYTEENYEYEEEDYVIYGTIQSFSSTTPCVVKVKNEEGILYEVYWLDLVDLPEEFANNPKNLIGKEASLGCYYMYLFNIEKNDYEEELILYYIDINNDEE